MTEESVSAPAAAARGDIGIDTQAASAMKTASLPRGTAARPRVPFYLDHDTGRMRHALMPA